MERLSGVHKYMNPCDMINLRVTGINSGSEYVKSDVSGNGGNKSLGKAFVVGGSTSGGPIGGGLTLDGLLVLDQSGKSRDLSCEAKSKMVPKIASMASTRPLCSIPSIFLSFSLLFVVSLLFFFSNSLISNPNPSISHNTLQNGINVYVAELPRSLNYGLIDKYWSSSTPDSRIPSDPDHPTRKTHSPDKYPPYPENPLIKQYSAEYWIMGDLETSPEKRIGSFAKRVFSESDADVVFVPFFATLSAEMELGNGKGSFRKKSGNEDYQRQRQVLDFVKNTKAWKRSNGRDHVFVLTDPVAMWHVREEIALSILLVVDFGGWFRQDSKSSNGTSLPERIQHTQVSVIKDVIVPYTHLLPRLDLSQNQRRHSLLYFKGAKHRHRVTILTKLISLSESLHCSCE
ncbi:hypothetical protein AXX17_AT1G35140 [Arabidopsis thaliana]|uniref:Exostosin GT47 domain-containing protein n=1 Tax=Arabidopsis thaliana TaxID=3702 RepID=A0A178W189_ARATH|nr:hypothetical protein AXX17_AT1G35140 [Arabidopsis thaliana]